MPLVSIIIPVFNGESTIEETVKSVMNQTFFDYELIIINDGSTDSTLDIIGKFKDPRIKIYSYPNAGLSTSRNRGVGQASGDFISFLDADDLWTTEKLASQVNSLWENPEAAVSYSWTDFIDQSSKNVGFGIHYTSKGYVFPDLLRYFFIGSGSNALIRRKVFDEVGLFDETLSAAEDWDMFLRIATKYQFTAIPYPHVLYRLTDNSMSRNVLRQERECIKVIEKTFSQEPGKSLLNSKKYTYANLYLYLASHALRDIADRQKGLIALRFLWQAIKYDPFVLKRINQTCTIIVKATLLIILPTKHALFITRSVKSIFLSIQLNRSRYILIL